MNLKCRLLVLRFLLVGWGVVMVACGSSVGELKTQLANNALMFEKTNIFQPKVGQVYLYHTQDVAMEIKQVKIVGEQASSFELIQSPTLPITLEAGTQQGKWFALQFFSSQEGTFSAHLEITYMPRPEATEQVLRISLQAQAVSSGNPARLLTDVSSNVVDFGTITTQDALVQEVMLFTEGDTTITIDELKLVDNDKMTFKMPFPLPLPFRVFPGKDNARSLLLQAQNTEVGTYEAWLLIASRNATNLTSEGTRLLKLKVEVVPYKQPGSVSFLTTNGQVYFRDVKPNERKEQSVTIYNPGELPVQILSIKINGDSSEAWSVENAPTAPWSLEGKGVEKGKEVKVVYRESNPRTRIAQLQVEYLRDPKQPDNKIVAALGLRHDTSQPWYTFDCISVDFGTVDKNQTVQRSCSLRSTGNIDLQIRGVKFVRVEGKENHFKWTSPNLFPIQLSPNQRVSVTLEYTPTETNANDEGRWVPDTNIVIDREEERPVLLVRGRSNR